MSDFRYATEIGGYSSPVRVQINIQIEGGVSSEDYTTIRNAVEVLEKLGYRYEEQSLEDNEDGEEDD